MFDEHIFTRSFPINDGIYNCLDEDVYSDRLKKVEIETYSERAQAFDDDKILNLSLEHKIALSPLMSLPPNAIILEIGGGDGRFSIHLMKSGNTVIASDIALGSVRNTKSMTEKYSIPNGVFATIDAEDLPFKDNTLDAIYMVASLHHLPHPEKAIDEFHRCLKSGGILLILREPASWQYTVFGPAYWIIRKIVRRKNKKSVSLADDETSGFSKRDFINLFARYENLRLKPVGYSYQFYYNWICLMNKFSKKPVVEKNKIKGILKKVDTFIEKLPIVKNYPWVWDVVCFKK